MWPDPESEPWKRLPPRTREALWKAGYTTPQDVAQISGTTLREIPGIGHAGYQAVRRIWKDPRGTGGTVVSPRSGAVATGTPGNPGNRGGHGALTRVTREKATRYFEERLETLAGIADSDEEATKDRIRAVDILGKYGPGTRREVEAVLNEDRAHEFVMGLAVAIQKHVTDEHILGDILEDFKRLVRAYF